MLTALSIATAIMSTAAVQEPSYTNTPEGAVRALYERVTWTPPAKPDWDKVREVFRPEAVFSLRLDRGELKVLTLDGFIHEWLEFAKIDAVVKNGFSEKIVRMKTTQYGGIANVFVLYEASVPNVMKTPQLGIDICHLILRDGKWSIVSIVNDVVTKDKPLPAELAG